MLVYGKNSCYEYLSKHKVKRVFLQRDFSDKKILSLIDCPIKYMDRFGLDKLVKGVHQGIVIEVDDYDYASLDELIDFDDGLVVMLDHLEDPHNLGAIVRTSEAFGVKGIIIPKDRSVEVNSTVIKTSVGAVDNICISMVINLSETIKYLKNNGFWIVGTDMKGENFRNIDYKGKTCIVIGNEGKGISDVVRKNCDFIASIPMYGKVNSLNASVACAVILSEAVNQIRK